MRRILLTLLALAAAAAAAMFWLTAPTRVDAARLADLDGSVERGEPIFHAAGCASCHATPEAEVEPSLGGGQRFVTEFGTFVAPNISVGAESGLKGWTLADFASALRHGTSPDGAHYYPAFPYASYTRMTDGDIADLWAYMESLPSEENTPPDHDVGFPFSIRAGLGLWKTLYLDDGWIVDVPPALERGRYLVEALGHCGECHTPRGALGGLDTGRWLAGAPNPSGKGQIPGLRPDRLDWSAADIAYYLETGFTPDFDSAGGEMVAVIESISKLPASDREAIAAYIKALPPLE